GPFGPTARLFDLSDGRGATIFIDVGYSHGGTLAGETKSAGATHAGSRRRHQSDLAFEPHGGPSLQSCRMVRSNVSPGCGRIGDSAPGNRASASPEPEAGVRKRGRSGGHDRLALDQGAVHLSCLGRVDPGAVMQGATVVPHEDVTGLPVVVGPGQLRPGRGGPGLVKQGFALILGKLDDVARRRGVATAEIESLAPGLGMDAHERMNRALDLLARLRQFLGRALSAGGISAVVVLYVKADEAPLHLLRQLLV